MAANPETAVADEPELVPWVPTPPTPDVHATIHMLAPAPSVEFRGDTYPGFTIKERPGAGALGDFTLSLLGGIGERLDFALALHEVATAIARWQPEMAGGFDLDDASTNPELNAELDPDMDRRGVPS